ncbi:hypothetical protein MAP00_009112 [Monascus purpureus]|nr:hypothetical protein MAP00_009112 [Monascus purpureus]
MGFVENGHPCRQHQRIASATIRRDPCVPAIPHHQHCKLHRPTDPGVPNRSKQHHLAIAVGLLEAMVGAYSPHTNLEAAQGCCECDNERVSKTIFDAAICQATGMLDEPLFITGAEKGQKWSSAESSEVFDMIKRTTIHVLSEAGMGTKVPWRE